MSIANQFSELPAHPRHVSPTSDRYRERFAAPPRLDDTGMMPGNLLGAFKGAARYMGLRGNIIVAVDYLFGLTKGQDWVGSARPIVWPSAREQSEALGLSPSGVRYLNRRLIELGLMVAKDSPTGARWGRRGHNGQIVEAYGFDLSPMAHRLAEFIAIRDAGREDDAIRAQLRRRKTIAIKSIGQVVRTAAERGFDTPGLYTLAEQAYTITEGLDPSADRPTLTGVVDELEKLGEAVLALYRSLAQAAEKSAPDSEQNAESSAMEMVDTDAAASVSRRPNNNYKLTDIPKVSSGSEQSSSDFGQDRAQQTGKETSERSEIKLPTVRPKEMVRLAPMLRTYLNEDLDRLDDRRAIMAVMRAAEECAYQGLGVSRPLWKEAQQVMGMWPATLAVMLVAAKDPEHFTRTAAHYFAGMVAKAKQGTLRLDRSIWGLRSHADAAGGQA